MCDQILNFLTPNLYFNLLKPQSALVPGTEKREQYLEKIGSYLLLIISHFYFTRVFLTCVGIIEGSLIIIARMS